MRTSRLFIVALVVGLLIRITTLPLPGHEDVSTWKIWTYAASRHVTTMYGVGGTPPTRGVVTWGEFWTTVDYPPFFLYEYAIVGKIYRALYPSFPNGMALHVAVKLPVLFANIALAWLLYAVVRRVSKRDEAARWAALAYFLNPATLFGGEMLGYVDPVYFLPAIAGLALAYFRRPFIAGVLIAIAVATKPQAVLIGPAFALLLWHAGGVRAMISAGVTFAATIVAIVLPYAVKGALPNMLLAFGSFDARRDTMSAYAANIGWILNWWLRGWDGRFDLGIRSFFIQVPRPLSITRFQELGYPNPRPITRAAVIVATLWAVWQARRTRDLAIAAAVGAFTVHAFFVLSVNMHEHHQLFEVPLLVLAAALRPRFRPILWVVSAIVALSINFLYGFGLGVGWAAPRMITGIDATVLLALINVVAMFWFANLLRQELAADERAGELEGLDGAA